MSLASQFAGITDPGAWYAALETAIGAAAAAAGSGGGGGGGGGGGSSTTSTQTQTVTIVSGKVTPTTGSGNITPDDVARRLQILNLIYY